MSDLQTQDFNLTMIKDNLENINKNDKVTQLSITGMLKDIKKIKKHDLNGELQTIKEKMEKMSTDTKKEIED